MMRDLRTPLIGILLTFGAVDLWATVTGFTINVPHKVAPNFEIAKLQVTVSVATENPVTFQITHSGGSVPMDPVATNAISFSGGNCFPSQAGGIAVGPTQCTWLYTATSTVNRADSISITLPSGSPGDPNRRKFTFLLNLDANSDTVCASTLNAPEQWTIAVTSGPEIDGFCVKSSDLNPPPPAPVCNALTSLRQVPYCEGVATVTSTTPPTTPPGLNLDGCVRADICLPTIGGLGGLPNIDGVVNDEPGALNTDPGWNGATLINLGEYHGSTRSATLEAGTAGGFLYLALIVTTPVISSQNRIVLGFSPQDGDSTHDWRIHVKPLPASVDTSPTDFISQPPDQVIYWRNSVDFCTGNNPLTATAGHWLIDNTRVAKKGSTWSIEMKIPIVAAASAGLNTGIYFPSAAPSTFRMYVNVLNTLNLATPTVLQDSWPSSQQICAGDNPCGTDIQIDHNTPPIITWGTGSLYSRPKCAGVSLAWSDIGVVDPNNPAAIISDMRRDSGPWVVPGSSPARAPASAAECAGVTGSNGPTNTFIARPLNNGSSGVPVRATFRIANWGIAGLFDPLPPPGVATTPELTLSPGATAPDRDRTTTWALTPEQSCKFSFRPHQCIHVDLDSSSPTAIFQNKSVERNMNFVPASTYSQQAWISGDQGPLPAGATKHRILIAIEKDQEGVVKVGGGTTVGGGDKDRVFHPFQSAQLGELIPLEPGASFASWIARGMAYTDNRLEIGGTVYHVVQKIGEFGYVARHDESITSWAFRFQGAGLQRIRDDLYLINVAPGEEAEVRTTIAANERLGLWRFFIDIGPNFPHGSFGNTTDGKWSVNAGFERFFAPNWSGEIIAGYHRFDNAFVSNPHIWQLSVGAKRYFGNAAWHPFLDASIGGYRFDPGHTTKFGGNAGAGVLYDVSPQWGIEGVYQFHTISTSGTTTNFSTLQVGLRLRL